MTTPPRPGYHLVFSDPGDKVSSSEFTDWYDNEHVPLRVGIPAYTSWHRWEAIDGKKPQWASSYDLTSASATRVPPYTSLASTRSARETRILRDIDTLDRRTYEEAQVTLPSLYVVEPGKPPPFAVFVQFDVKPGKEEGFGRWYADEHVAMLQQRCPGWIRSRRFVLEEWAQGGIQGAMGQMEPPKCLYVAEFASMEWAEDEKVKAAANTPWAVEILKDVAREEYRVFKLHKSWERRS